MGIFDAVWKGLIKRLSDSEPTIVQGEDSRHDSYLEYVKQQADSVPENNMHRVILATYRDLRNNNKFGHEEALRRAKEAGIRWEATRRRMMAPQKKAPVQIPMLPDYTAKTALPAPAKRLALPDYTAKTALPGLTTKALPAAAKMLALPDKTVKALPAPAKMLALPFIQKASKAIPLYGPADHHKCRNCGFKYPSNENVCPRCGAAFGSKRPQDTNTTETAMENSAIMTEREEQKESGFDRLNMSDNAKKVFEKSGRKGNILAKIYESLIFIIAGIFCLFVPNLLGIPTTFAWLAIALIIFIPAYIIFPGKHTVTDAYGSSMSTQAMAGFLVPKAMFKILAFAFILLQVSLINLPATLILAFIFYFLMPFSYESNQPYEMIESWARFGFGVYISILFMIVFGFTNNVGQSLTLLAMAFFATVPVHHETSGGINVVVNTSKRMSSKSGSVLDKMFFIFLMLGSLVLAYSGGVTFDPVGNISQLLFLIVWILSFLTGIYTSPEGRPAIGIVMVFVALFAFSGMYSGVIGQAVFGYWWPQIDSFGQTYMAPLGDAWTQAQSSIGDSWTMLTCPTCYFEKQKQKEQAVKSVVKTGGSKLSIEASQFSLFPSIPGTFEPQEPLIGTIELTNGGEFESSGVNLDLWASYRDVSASSPEDEVIGKFNRLTCSGQSSVPTPATSVANCNWASTTYPSEVKMSTFVYDKGASGIWVLKNGDDLAQVNPIIDPKLKVVTYVFSGKTIKINAGITYGYNVNVTIPVEVIGFTRYTKLLQNNQMQMIDLTSQYTGGPVKATLWTPKQPVRTGEPSVVVASILNEGSGVIKSVKYIIAVPKNLISGTELGSAAGLSSFDSCVGPVDFPPNFYKITCTYSKDIEAQEFKRVSFFITPQMGADTESVTTQINGYAEYTYVKNATQSLVIANAPPQ